MANITTIDLNPTNIVNSYTGSIASQANGFTSLATGLIDGTTTNAINSVKSNIELYTGILDDYIDTSKAKEYLKSLKNVSVEYSTDTIISSAENKINSEISSLSVQLSTSIEKFEFPDFDIEEQAKEIKKQVDKTLQDVANVPAKIISDLEKTAKKILNIIDGWIDTSEDVLDIATSGKAMGKMVNDAIDLLGKLPLPAIPGLDMVKSLVGQVQNIKIPTVADITDKATSIVSNSANSLTNSTNKVTSIV